MSGIPLLSDIHNQSKSSVPSTSVKMDLSYLSDISSSGLFQMLCLMGFLKCYTLINDRCLWPWTVTAFSQWTLLTVNRSVKLFTHLHSRRLSQTSEMASISSTMIMVSTLWAKFFCFMAILTFQCGRVKDSAFGK